MANELTVTAMARFLKGSTDVAFGKQGVQTTVAGTDHAQMTQNVGTAEEALNLGDVTTPGLIVIQNRDPTNFVTVRAASGGVDMLKLLPGDVQLFRFGSGATAPFVKADTGACVIEFLLVEA